MVMANTGESSGDDLGRQLTALLTACPNCKAEISIARFWNSERGGESGALILECHACGHIFHYRLKAKASDCKIRHGARLLGSYDNANPGEDEAVLKRYDLDSNA